MGFAGTRQPVVREDADGFEYGGNNFVIQILRGQFFLPGTKQACADVPGEIRLRILSYDCGGHNASLFRYEGSLNLSVRRNGKSRKRMDNVAGTNCETTAAACTRPCEANRPSCRRLAHRKNVLSSRAK